MSDTIADIVRDMKSIAARLEAQGELHAANLIWRAVRYYEAGRVT